jgi:lauroyl/myristoyl acyltransferase
MHIVNFRHVLSWKSLFYGVMLPALRPFPALADRALAASGRLCWSPPHRRRRLARQFDDVADALGIPRPTRSVRAGLAANSARFTSRDYLLDGLRPEEIERRFDVSGLEYVDDALSLGRGVLLLGSHFGAHVAGLHWLARKEWPLRFLIQRPRHVSKRLDRAFERDAGDSFAQSAFFLRRHMPPIECTACVLRVHSALRKGMGVYLSGDIPWKSQNARPARLLGREQTFLSIWADLAALSGAPVVPVFCAHRPGGRHLLTFDAPWTVRPGEESACVVRYLQRLESAIRDDPTDAVAHVTWPCYGARGEPSINVAAASPETARIPPARGTSTQQGWA